MRTVWPSRCKGTFKHGAHSAVVIGHKDGSEPLIASGRPDAASGRETLNPVVTGLTLDRNRAAVVVDHLGHQREPKARSCLAAADKRLEQVVAYGRPALPAPLSRTVTVKGSRTLSHGRLPSVWRTLTVVGCGKRDLAILSAGLGGVLDQVQEHLDQRIPIPVNLRQRGVIGLL